MSGLRRGGARRGLVSVAAATALLGGAAVPAVMLAPVAAAHSVLISVDPQDGSELENSPEQIVLTFNEEINQNFVSVAVTSATDSTNRVVGDPTVDGDTVTARVEDLGPGNYTIGYRVTSADGHVVTGSSVFSVVDPDGEAGGAGTPGATAGEAEEPETGEADRAQADTSDTSTADDGAAEATDSDSDGGVNPAIWIVGGLAVVLIGGAFFLLRRGD